ncbi:cupin [Polynucleobacter sp. UK-Gri1-W3]|uniref:cupin n=1 Tax=Polynucleobacter sp. UK-Gri1-W3 TaxID=1819737 RepID=UPI001C0B909F|nr:cupin [Polynucleobacter sp. UK-Gri1-W3]MBU3537655.1 cupin [Polynucleobacter sp. UK-Gri1-W3]
MMVTKQMKQEVFLDKLVKEGFPEPVFVEREVGGFLDLHSHPYEVQALVLEGQIDIIIGGIKSTFLAGDVFHLLPNQIHTENYGAKGVKYLASRKSLLNQEELSV